MLTPWFGWVGSGSAKANQYDVSGIGWVRVRVGSAKIEDQPSANQ